MWEYKTDINWVKDDKEQDYLLYPSIESTGGSPISSRKEKVISRF